jgi:phage shock protein C
MSRRRHHHRCHGEAEAGPWHGEARHRHAFERPYNPHRLYRERENRRIMGLCAGIATYFGIDPLWPRLAAVAGAFFFPFPVIPAYFIAGLILPKRPPQLFASKEEEALWREVTIAPDRSFHALKLKFRELEARLARLESDLVSGDLELRRKFRDLGV